MDNLKKTKKEEFISGHSGSEIHEIQLLLTVAVFCFFLFSKLINKISDHKHILQFVPEFLILILPVIYSLMISNMNYLALFLAFLISVSFLLKPNNHQTPPINFDFITPYRAYLTLYTVICILAVDFKVFPRKYAKVETFGTSLMDIGVGCFIFSSGLVAGKRLSDLNSNNFKKVIKTIRTSLVVITIGIIRTLVTKSVNYQVF